MPKRHHHPPGPRRHRFQVYGLRCLGIRVYSLGLWGLLFICDNSYIYIYIIYIYIYIIHIYYGGGSGTAGSRRTCRVYYRVYRLYNYNKYIYIYIGFRASCHVAAEFDWV